MASSTNTAETPPGTIYRWIERKPLTEAVSWTSREKFWLMTGACHYGIHDWKSVAQVVRNAGEQYRPIDWYTSKSCERQFKVIISNLGKEVKSLPLNDMLQLVAEGLRLDYIRDAIKAKDLLNTKYWSFIGVLTRMSQGHLSRNEVVSLYSQARRNDIEGKQYMEQLMTRQNASLASENSSSGLSEETIKWNTPSAPLLTSLLRSRNTIPANRTVTTIASLLQSTGGTSRTRSGKILPLTSSVRTTSTQGTPTLSKLLEAPANPYLSSPPQSGHKNKPSEVIVSDKLVGHTSRKENSLSTSLNKVRVDHVNTSGSFNQINKSDLSASKRQTPKSSPVSAVKNGSKSNSNIVSLLSDSENDEDSKSPVQNTHLKEKKDTNIVCRIEPRATRSQTRAEGNFKQINDIKMSDGKKERETSRENGGSQLTEAHHLIEDDLIDIDQIEVEPLSSVQDEIITQTPSKMTRSSVQRSLVNAPAENFLTNKVKNKEINNQMLEEISANFVLNSTMKNVATEYKNVMVGRSRVDSANISGCIVPISDSAVKDAIILRNDGQPFPTPVNMLTTYDGKILKQKRIIDLKGANLKCIDGKIAFPNSMLLVKKPFNIKLASELKNNSDDVQLKNNDQQKTIKINNSPQHLVQLHDGNQSFPNDNITLGNDVIVNVDDRTTKIQKLSISTESQNLPLTAVVSSNDSPNVSGISKSSGVQSNDKRTKNDKALFNVLRQPLSHLNIASKKPGNQDSVSKIEVHSNTTETNNRYIKELDFDFDQSISQTSLTEFYNDVEEIVEMHSFDNEDLNSLIECNSLDNSEIEEPQNSINVSRGDSSVNESDSTIGAFDTFAQITRVLPPPPPTVPIPQQDEIKVKREKYDADISQCSPIHDTEISQCLPIHDTEISQCLPSNQLVGFNIKREKYDADISQCSPIHDTEISQCLPIHDTEISQCLPSNQPHSFNIKREIYDEDSECSPIHDTENSQCLPIHDTDISQCFPIHDTEISQCLPSNQLVGFNIKREKYDTKICDSNDQCNNPILIEDEIDDSNHSNSVKPPPEPFETIEIASSDDEVVTLDSSDDDDDDDDTPVTGTSNLNTIIYNPKQHPDSALTKLLSLNLITINDIELNKVVVPEELTSGMIFKNIREIQRKKNVTESINDVLKLLSKKIKSKKALRGSKHNTDSEAKKHSKTIELKEYEAHLMNKANVMENVKEIEMKKPKEIEMKKAKEIDMKKAKEIEMKIVKEIEMKKAKEIEMKKAKEIEMKAKEIEMKKAKEIEMKKAKEIEMKKAKEIEMKKAKEIEMKKAKEIEMKIVKEIEMKKAKEIEMKKAKEIEMKAREIEMRKAKEIEMKKAKEIEMRKAKEIEIQKAKEIEMRKEIEAREVAAQKVKEIELQKAKEAHKQRIKDAELAKQAEILRVTKEAEAKKAEEAEMLRKAKEEEYKREKAAEVARVKEAELVKSKEQEASLAERNLIAQRRWELQKRLNLEAELRRKKEEVTKSIQNQLNKAREKELKRVMAEAEIKKAKDAKLREAKHIEMKEKKEKVANIKQYSLKKVLYSDFRTGKLTEREMLTESVGINNLQREIVDKLNNSTIVKLSCHENEIKESGTEIFNSKQILNKILELEEKKSKALKEVENKINTRTRGLKAEEKLKNSNLVSKNISIKSTSSVKPLGSSSSGMTSASQQTKNEFDDNTGNIDINKCDRDMDSSECNDISGKSRTRSASSFKQKTNIETISTLLHKSKDKSEVVIPKVTVGVRKRILTSSHHAVPSRSFNQPCHAQLSRCESVSNALSESNLGKQLTVPLININLSTRCKQLYAEHCIKHPVISIVPLENPQKTINVTEKLEKPAPKKRGRKRRIDVQMSNSDKPNLQIGETSAKEVEPLAKRTRRSVETRASKKETVVKSPVKTTKKKLLNYFYQSISEKNKCLSLFDKDVKDSSPDNALVKNPIYMQDIKRKINSGEINNLAELQINLMLISYNAIMMNRSDNISFNDATNFQAGLFDECQSLRREIGKDQCKSSLEKNGKKIANVHLKSDNDNGCSKAGRVLHDNKTKTYNRFTRSSSDSESDRALPPKKRKRKYFYKSNNDVDSDCYDSEFV